MQIGLNRTAWMVSALVAVSLSASAASAVTIESVATGKTGDGNWTTCQRESQLNSESWRMDSFEAKATSDGKVALSTVAARLFCGKDSDDKIGWQEGATTARQDWVDKIDGNHYTKWIDGLEFWMLGANGKLTSEKAEDSDDVILASTVAAEKLVAAGDLAAFKAGKKVLVRLTVFGRGLMFYKVNGGADQPLGLRPLGSYTAQFWMAKTAAELGGGEDETK